MKTINVYGIIILLLLSLSASAQSDKDKAMEMAQKAIDMEDDGDVAGALKLLYEAQKLDKSNTTYAYEIAYAHYVQKDYKKAQKELEDIINSKNATERYYQLLGNAYDMQENTKDAVETYNAGIKKFPKSGKLQSELGILYLYQKDYNKAINYFERGIEVEPDYSTNYYWATKLYCSSDEEVWGMIYGEIFLNLESNTKRTAEISKMLYDTYKSGITYSDTSTSVSFCKNAVLSLEDLKKHKMPFGNFGYEMALTMATIGSHHIDLNSLDTIRTKFVHYYYDQKKDKEYPNVLFDYQKALKEAGYFPAYNHWLLMKGDETAFAKWATEHKDEWATFSKWYPDHKLKVDENHHFYRNQY